jgi:diaminohydroxyphosphoribosylaminopyrimidine deaminase/5-amino-6-(5-phosphoribosylamino)uracil reductase
MLEAIGEARKAFWKTHPNPMVGAVIVSNGQVVSKGHHQQCGHPHAEVEALLSLGGRAQGMDVYVTLEPCNHQGKTAPCTEALIEARVGRVFVGVIDPDPRVSGSGVQRLREAGIEVHVGLMEEECRRLNAPFFKRMTRGLPWVVSSSLPTTRTEGYDVVLGRVVHVIPDDREVSGTREFLESLVRDYSTTTVLVTHPDLSQELIQLGLVDQVVG